MEVKKDNKMTVAVDMIIFSIRSNDLKVLLVKRGVEPFKGMWAIPGGRVEIKEPLEYAAKRELKEETGVSADYLEQLYSFGDPDRDPRGRVVSVTYFALVKSEKLKLKASTDAADARWFSASKLPRLAFDHDKIMKYALRRLKWKFEYTTVAFSLLPKRFTLTDLQKIYEIVFEKKFDKRNFRKKIHSLDLVRKTKQRKAGVSHRPPQLYSLKKKIGDIIEIL
jgi:8-oxo-dGTP diphosphatase